MTIETGHDNLNGGGLQGDNATVTVAGLAPFHDVNQSDTWDDYSVANFPLVPLPSTPKDLSALSSVKVSTDFTGVFPDNWDILSIELKATVTVGGGALVTMATPGGRATNQVLQPVAPIDLVPMVGDRAPGQLSRWLPADSQCPAQRGPAMP